MSIQTHSRFSDCQGNPVAIGDTIYVPEKIWFTYAGSDYYPESIFEITEVTEEELKGRIGYFHSKYSQSALVGPKRVAHWEMEPRVIPKGMTFFKLPYPVNLPEYGGLFYEELYSENDYVDMRGQVLKEGDFFYHFLGSLIQIGYIGRVEGRLVPLYGETRSPGGGYSAAGGGNFEMKSCVKMELDYGLPHQWTWEFVVFSNGTKNSGLIS